MLVRILLIVAGTVCLVLGILGIFVPGLPTTPFLLLTAALYMRSSDHLYNKLVGNRFIGSYLTEWRRTKGLSIRAKIKSIILMWTMIALSVIFGIEAIWLKVTVILIGITGTIVMGFIVPTGGRDA
jgi:uncharacterized membrane protein YbaN (DUF454 family)